ncbi:transcriptional regulator [Streptomyces mashuensis]|uniref:Transcriptional regulator n=1 Tax=Streptomyces mashuensis TaxID=33904 RepID=A0A919EEY4_9ACTN|nr:helix-turn-helix transcriptional regulator [Streptomyces mashuensis]GHF60433.1 transcriptional regulator [Streptomyces mashuensis]
MTALPTVRRRMLGAELRSLREELGLTVNEMAARLNWPQSKVSRVETGRSGIRRQEVEATLDAYGVSDMDKRQHLADLARDSRQRMWWTPYSDVITARYAEYIAFEAEACTMLTFQSVLVPGLLQTAAYTHAITKALQPEAGPEELDALVNVRLARQNATLRRSEPLALWAIIDEAALRRLIGGRDVMTEQLRHLQQASELSHITLQVLPNSAGAHAGLLGPFVILRFPTEGSLDVVHTESQVSNIHLVRDSELTAYGRTFDRLRSQALAPTASRDLIAAIMRDLE